MKNKDFLMYLVKNKLLTYKSIIDSETKKKANKFIIDNEITVKEFNKLIEDSLEEYLRGERIW